MEKMNGFWTKEISLVLLLFEEKKRKEKTFLYAD